MSEDQRRVAEMMGASGLLQDRIDHREGVIDTNNSKVASSDHHADPRKNNNPTATERERDSSDHKESTERDAEQKEQRSNEPRPPRGRRGLDVPGWVQAISTVVLALVTVVYTVYAQRTLAISRENFVTEQRPYIWLPCTAS